MKTFSGTERGEIHGRGVWGVEAKSVIDGLPRLGLKFDGFQGQERVVFADVNQEHCGTCMAYEYGGSVGEVDNDGEVWKEVWFDSRPSAADIRLAEMVQNCYAVGDHVPHRTPEEDPTWEPWYPPVRSKGVSLGHLTYQIADHLMQKRSETLTASQRDFLQGFHTVTTTRLSGLLDFMEFKNGLNELCFVDLDDDDHKVLEKTTALRTLVRPRADDLEPVIELSVVIKKVESDNSE